MAVECRQRFEQSHEKLLYRNSWEMKIKDMTESNHINTGKVHKQDRALKDGKYKPLISF